MTFSVVFEKATGRIRRQGDLGADHRLTDDEARIEFGDWINTAGMAVDLNTLALVEATARTKARQGASWEVLRDERTRRLAETDYLMTIDYPISEENRERVKVYRQALRDLPANISSTVNVEWPVFPKFD